MADTSHVDSDAQKLQRLEEKRRENDELRNQVALLEARAAELAEQVKVLRSEVQVCPQLFD